MATLYRMGKKNVKNSKNVLEDLEESVRIQTKRKQIETAILGTVALTGFLTMALMAPNAVKVLQKALPDLCPVNQKQSVKRAIGRLIRNGYIQKQNERYYLSEEGNSRLYSLLLRSNSLMHTRRKEKWDKKWRIVTFDIPEKERIKRNTLRSYLIQTGFVKLQESVWVYPYRCDEVIALLKFKLKLGRRAVYIIADGIEGDEWLRDHFKLPPSI